MYKLLFVFAAIGMTACASHADGEGVESAPSTEESVSSDAQALTFCHPGDVRNKTEVQPCCVINGHMTARYNYERCEINVAGGIPSWVKHTNECSNVPRQTCPQKPPN